MSERRQNRKEKGLCHFCDNSLIEGQSLCEGCRSKGKEKRQQAKKKVFEHYGGECACCGEDNPKFLTVDHINNNGADHREKLVGNRRGGGTQLYRALIKERFPSGIQTLCYNCNCGRQANGGVCPHEELFLEEKPNEVCC